MVSFLATCVVSFLAIEKEIISNALILKSYKRLATTGYNAHIFEFLRKSYF